VKHPSRCRRPVTQHHVANRKYLRNDKALRGITLVFGTIAGRRGQRHSAGCRDGACASGARISRHRLRVCCSSERQCCKLHKNYQRTMTGELTSRAESVGDVRHNAALARRLDALVIRSRGEALRLHTRLAETCTSSRPTSTYDNCTYPSRTSTHLPELDQ
jgi:hypothetical protein